MIAFCIQYAATTHRTSLTELKLLFRNQFRFPQKYKPLKFWSKNIFFRIMEIIPGKIDNRLPPPLPFA
jgi:hypothetical protein